MSDPKRDRLRLVANPVTPGSLFESMYGRPLASWERKLLEAKGNLSFHPPRVSGRREFYRSVEEWGKLFR